MTMPETPDCPSELNAFLRDAFWHECRVRGTWDWIRVATYYLF